MTMFAENNLRAKRHPRNVTALVAIVALIWAATHLLTLAWGLPNLKSFAPDTIDANLDYTPYRMMENLCFKYPPLQFLVLRPFLVNESEKGMKKVPDLIGKRSWRIWRMRLVNAIMTFLTSLAIAFFALCLFKSSMSAFLSSVLFLLNPVSLYYSHTTNMDQPYVMWWIFSWISLVVGFSLWRKPGIRLSMAVHALCGVFMGCAFCTKDPVIFMYPMPLLTVLIWIWRKRGSKWLDVLVPPVCWGVGFFLATVVIYSVAGGWNVFKTHFVWISTSPTTIGDYRQYGTALTERFALLWQSVLDLGRMLDFPCVMGVGFIVLILFRYRERRVLTGLRRNLLLIAALTGLVFVSYQCLFIQIVRFSFPRYYLALLPFVCLFIGGCWSMLARRHLRSYWIPAALLGTLAVIIGVQQLNSLSGDTRCRLRSFLRRELERFGSAPLVGTVSSTFGDVYLFAEGEPRSFRAVRNWSLSQFGYLTEREKSLLLNPYSLSMLSPSFLVCKHDLSENDRQLLARNSYTLLTSITPPRPWVKSWFIKGSPAIDVYALSASNPCLDPELNEWLESNSFDDVLLVTQACVDLPQVGRQADIVGKRFPDFTIPDAETNYFNPLIFRFIAQAYEDAGRFQEAAKTYAFIMNNCHRNEAMLDQARRFFVKHPELSPKK